MLKRALLSLIGFVFVWLVLTVGVTLIDVAITLQLLLASALLILLYVFLPPSRAVGGLFLFTILVVIIVTLPAIFKRVAEAKCLAELSSKDGLSPSSRSKYTVFVKCLESTDLRFVLLHLGSEISSYSYYYASDTSAQ